VYFINSTISSTYQHNNINITQNDTNEFKHAHIEAFGVNVTTTCNATMGWDLTINRRNGSISQVGATQIIAARIPSEFGAWQPLQWEWWAVHFLRICCSGGLQQLLTTRFA